MNEEIVPESIEETPEVSVERKYRQNRNTLAAFLRSRTKMFWSVKKGTYNVGKNKTKLQKKK